MYNEHYEDDYDIQSDAEQCFVNSPYTPVGENSDHNWYEEPSQITDNYMQQHQKIHPYSEYKNKYEPLAEIYPPDQYFSNNCKAPGLDEGNFKPQDYPHDDIQRQDVPISERNDYRNLNLGMGMKARTDM